VKKSLLLEPRQRCRDFSLLKAHRGDGKRFVVHADEILTAFLELESVIQGCNSWKIVAQNSKQAGWNCGCVSSTDQKGRQFWVAAAERDGAGRFVVHADELLTAFLELERAVCIGLLIEQI
jgi:hypothetical protein